jgi:hypothetical protein
MNNKIIKKKTKPCNIKSEPTGRCKMVIRQARLRESLGLSEHI